MNENTEPNSTSVKQVPGEIDPVVFMNTRKVIQISVAGVNNTNNTQCDYITTALCNDGTMWEQHGFSNEWHSIPPIPQD